MEAKQNYNMILNEQPLYNVKQIDRKIMELPGNFSRMLSVYRVLFYTTFENFLLIRQWQKVRISNISLGPKTKLMKNKKLLFWFLQIMISMHIRKLFIVEFLVWMIYIVISRL